MSQSDPDRSQTLEKLKLVIYLVPVFGVVPATWSLASGRGSRREQQVSRLVITLAFVWLVVYGGLAAGSQLAPGLSLRFLVGDTLVTTGYFLTNLWLMVKLLQGKSVKLPGFSRLSNRLP